MSPACGSKVTAVAASDKQDNMWINSNLNQMVDLIAPGVDVYSVGINGNIAKKTGTSMAAPHVSASAVLMLNYFKEFYNYTLSPAGTECALKQSGANISYGNETYKRIDVLSALYSNMTACGEDVYRQENESQNGTFKALYSGDCPDNCGCSDWNTCLFNNFGTCNANYFDDNGIAICSESNEKYELKNDLVSKIN